MNRYQEVLSLLEQAVKSPENLEKNINQFHKIIYDEEIECSDWEKEVLGDLAYDLEYYVDDPEMRKEAPSYYGEEKAVTEIADILIKLKKRIQKRTYNTY